MLCWISTQKHPIIPSELKYLHSTWHCTTIKAQLLCYKHRQNPGFLKRGCGSSHQSAGVAGPSTPCLPTLGHADHPAGQVDGDFFKSPKQVRIPHTHFWHPVPSLHTQWHIPSPVFPFFPLPLYSEMIRDNLCCGSAWYSQPEHGPSATCYLKSVPKREHLHHLYALPMTTATKQAPSNDIPNANQIPEL